MKEIWKDCFGYEEFLLVSNLGNFYSKERIVDSGKQGIRVNAATPKKLSSDKDGYKLLSISKDKKAHTEKAHRLVLKTFQPNINSNNLQVNHIDGIKSNNKLDNLEWVTPKENMAHAIKTGLVQSPKDYFISNGNRRGYKGDSICIYCNKVFRKKTKNQKLCTKECSIKKSTKAVNRPSKSELYKELCISPNFTLLSEKYGVSGNAIRKWCKSYNIPFKTSDYKKINKEHLNT